MKTISVVVPTFNEESNIQDIYKRLTSVLSQYSKYTYEIIFIDNYSTDSTRDKISKVCELDEHVKAIFNAKNFGFSRSIFYGLIQAKGDCVILIFADMQDPPEIIQQFIEQWENGYKIVTGIKTESQENPVIFFVRNFYYKLLRIISEIDHIEQFDGFGLYDQSFIQILRDLEDPVPYLRGIIAELGYPRKDVFYEQAKREKGKSKFNFFKMYDLAMLGITSYSKAVMRISIFLGSITAIVSLIIALYTLIYKLFNWDSFPVGTAAISIGVFFFGAVQLFFIGFLGEYILNINTRVMKHPLVIEEKRINF